MPRTPHIGNIFNLADHRGNNPHGTRETSEHEGRRRNAGRYETVGDLDRALDVRARRVPALPGRLVAPQLGSVPQQAPPTGLFGILALVAVGAGIAYVLMKRDEGPEEFDAVQALPSTTTQNVTVQPAVASPVLASPAPGPVVTVNPAPSVVVAPKRRRRRKPVEVTDTVAGSITVTSP